MKRRDPVPPSGDGQLALPLDTLATLVGTPLELISLRSADAGSSRRLIRLREVLHRTGLSRSTVYRRMELGQFPKRYPLGGRIVAWAEREIDQWIAEQVAG